MRLHAPVVSFILIVLARPSLFLHVNAAPSSTWVFYDSNGTLQYHADPNGNRIIDYSQAGYGGGGVAIPNVPSRLSITPSGDDDTAAIQSALLNVGSMTPDANGFRGAVLLEPGTFSISAKIHLNVSGVVLRGSGSGSDGTVLSMKGPPFFQLFDIAGSGSAKLSNTVNMAATYVPAGAKSFNVTSTAGFTVGDTVFVHRPVTTAWIQFLGMDKLVRNGQPQTWLAPGSEILTDRVVEAINGNQITVDVPLTDSWDPQYLSPPGGSLSKYAFPGRISNVAVENLAIIAPVDTQTNNFSNALVLDNLVDAWIRNVRIQDTHNSIAVNEKAKRVTLENVQVVHTFFRSQAAPPADFHLVGTQTLVNNCSVVGKDSIWPFVTQVGVTGPIVLLKCFAEDRGFEPHQRWATGLLADLSNFPGTHGEVGYINRGNFGSGHGWTSAWSVAWNVEATTFHVEQPPGTQNWAIGCKGKRASIAAPGGDRTLMPDGIYESLGTSVTPGSLYLAQLQQRKGIAALNAIGYADVDGNPFQSPSGASVRASALSASATSGTLLRAEFRVYGGNPSIVQPY